MKALKSVPESIENRKKFPKFVYYKKNLQAKELNNEKINFTISRSTQFFSLTEYIHQIFK